jgi:bifunctional non-homologous end joining protein LigD
MPSVWRPMPLVPVPAAFDHPDWVFELKHDGFRALAHIDGHRCTLVSRRGHVYTQFPMLAEDLAHAVRARSCVLDGEIVCLAPDGRSLFNRLLFRRDWPHFVAFDVLSIDGEDVRASSLLERKRRLRAIMPRLDSRLVYMDHVARRGAELFDAVCAGDLEGIVAKWKHGRYHSDGGVTSWLKIRNPQYSQMGGRAELFGARQVGSRSKRARPVLCPELRALQVTLR